MQTKGDKRKILMFLNDLMFKNFVHLVLTQRFERSVRRSFDNAQGRCAEGSKKIALLAKKTIKFDLATIFVKNPEF